MSGRPRSSLLLATIALGVMSVLGGTPFAAREALVPMAPPRPSRVEDSGGDWAVRKGRRTTAAALKRAAKKRRQARARSSKRRRIRS